MSFSLYSVTNIEIAVLAPTKTKVSEIKRELKLIAVKVAESKAEMGEKWKHRELSSSFSI